MKPLSSSLSPSFFLSTFLPVLSVWLSCFFFYILLLTSKPLFNSPPASFYSLYLIEGSFVRLIKPDRLLGLLPLFQSHVCQVSFLVFAIRLRRPARSPTWVCLLWSSSVFRREEAGGSSRWPYPSLRICVCVCVECGHVPDLIDKCLFLCLFTQPKQSFPHPSPT